MADERHSDYNELDDLEVFTLTPAEQHAVEYIERLDNYSFGSASTLIYFSRGKCLEDALQTALSCQDKSTHTRLTRIADSLKIYRTIHGVDPVQAGYRSLWLNGDVHESVPLQHGRPFPVRELLGTEIVDEILPIILRSLIQRNPKNKLPPSA